MTGALPLSLWQVGAAAALIALNGLLSFGFGLGLEKKLAVATVRTLVQLTLLGWLLLPVFQHANGWLVAAMGCVMVALAAREALARSSRRTPGDWGTTTIALLIGCGSTAVLGSTVIIGADPWWTPQVAIPLLGMMLGNSLTGVSLGMERVLTMLDDQRGLVEARLALGATWWEAARPVAAESLRVAMVPILNVMSAVGLVTIPGMMTGQILGGTDPVLASRYQIVVLFLIAASVGLASVAAVLALLWSLFDDAHRLRSDRIQQRSKR
jgi:putative ABC transport system permease protein